MKTPRAEPTRRVDDNFGWNLSRVGPLLNTKLLVIRGTDLKSYTCMAVGNIIGKPTKSDPHFGQTCRAEGGGSTQAQGSLKKVLRACNGMILEGGVNVPRP